MPLQVVHKQQSEALVRGGPVYPEHFVQRQQSEALVRGGPVYPEHFVQRQQSEPLARESSTERVLRDAFTRVPENLRRGETFETSKTLNMIRGR